MDISDYIIGFNAIAMLVVPFLFKHYIPSYLQAKAKNLATKQDIAEITDKIESVKTFYEKKLVKFTTYHQKQSEVILELYRLLIVTVDDIKIYSRQAIITPDKLNNSKIVINKLSDYYNQHRIFLNSDLKLKVEKVNRLITDSFMNRNYADFAKMDMSDRSLLFVQIYDDIFQLADPLLNELEEIFRKILSE